MGNNQPKDKAEHNLLIYNAVRNVPKEAKKSFSNGSFAGTDINPMWRIKTLTEQFGPAGIGWYTEVIEHWKEEINGEVLTNVAINLYIRVDGEWSKPIYGIGGNKALQVFTKSVKVSDEAYKMAYTDAISVAAKALGIGADVYFEQDKTKYTKDYVDEQKQEPVKEQAKKTAPVVAEKAPEKSKMDILKEAISKAKDYAALMEIFNSNPDMTGNKDFINALTARKKEVNTASK